MKIIKGYKAPEFDGSVIRILAHETVDDVDPFLMLDHFETNKKEIGMGSWHPHRGIETFTYIVRGKMKEKDTINGELEVNEGGALHLSSGSGMYHTSVPTISEVGIEGFQLWFNIPMKNKMDKPYSAAFQNKDFPHVIENGSDVKVLTGIYKDTVGPLDKSNLGLRMLDVTVKHDIILQREKNKKGYIYIFKGKGVLNTKQVLENKTAYILDEGEYVFMNKSKEELRFIFCEGTPLNEPIVWRGPIVMNTSQEIEDAYIELNNKTFIKGERI